MSAAHSILIVEDERIVAQDLQQSLGEMGYDAYAIASSAEEAMLRAGERRPDVVLMDIRIKGSRDGVETASMMRERFGVPVIYLTAHADDATIARAKHTEPYGYLVKPVKSSELRSVIEVSIFRHAADRRVREQERWLSTTLRSIADAVITVDVAGNVSFMNACAEQLLGVALDDARGRPAREVLKLVSTPASSMTPLDEALWSRSAVYLSEGTLDRPGERLIISDSAAPVMDYDELLGAVMIFRDVTAERDLRRRLEFADRLASLGTMAAGVAHEINNPLAVIAANSQSLTREMSQWLEAAAANTPASDSQSRAVERRLIQPPMVEQWIGVHAEIQAAVSRIERIVGDLKVFSRAPELGGAHADVNAALDWAARATSHELHHRGRLVLDIPRMPLVAIDQSRLEQVLVNLLVNAALALPSGHAENNEVRVSTRVLPDGRVELAVADTGAGMEPETLAHIFEPFFTTRPRGVGTGLGLSTCHGIVQAAGGTIDVESKLGAGSVFRIRLPVAALDAVPSCAPTALPLGVTARRARVLVVDDDALGLRAMQRLLGSDHDVSGTRSAREALELLEEGARFDIVLSDLVMPDMGGRELYLEMCRRYPEQASRLVFVTGGAVDDELWTFLQGLTNRPLEKPVSIPELQALILDFRNRGMPR